MCYRQIIIVWAKCTAFTTYRRQHCRIWQFSKGVPTAFVDGNIGAAIVCYRQIIIVWTKGTAISTSRRQHCQIWRFSKGVPTAFVDGDIGGCYVCYRQIIIVWTKGTVFTISRRQHCRIWQFSKGVPTAFVDGDIGGCYVCYRQIIIVWAKCTAYPEPRRQHIRLRQGLQPVLNLAVLPLDNGAVFGYIVPGNALAFLVPTGREPRPASLKKTAPPLTVRVTGTPWSHAPAATGSFPSPVVRMGYRVSLPANLAWRPSAAAAGETNCTVRPSLSAGRSPLSSSAPDGVREAVAGNMCPLLSRWEDGAAPTWRAVTLWGFLWSETCFTRSFLGT